MTRYFAKLLLTFLFIIQTCLHADDDTFLDFKTGLRYDALTTKINLYDATGTKISVDNIHIKHVPTLNVGFIGKYTLCNWYFRGFTSYGWIAGNGRYDESAGPSSSTTLIDAGIRRATTIDFDAGLGYLFDITNCFGIAPIIGYSYDMQRIKIQRATAGGILDPALNSLKYTNWWQGPWLGVDFIYDTDLPCGAQSFTLTSGYELHLANWRATWVLDTPDVFNGDFSDTRKGSLAYGHVLFFDARWNFRDCWNLGFGAKLQDWTCYQGSLTPKAGRFSAVSSTVASARVENANWKSGTFYIDLGWNF